MMEWAEAFVIVCVAWAFAFVSYALARWQR